VVVAVAGGIGAAVGASLGQFVQWWREHVRTEIEERRRSEDRDDKLSREQREIRRAAYDDAALALEEIIDAVDFYAFTLRSALKEEVWQTEKRRQGASNLFSSFWKTFQDRERTCRRRLITVASDDLNPLRGYLLIARAVVQEHSPKYDLTTTPEDPARISQFNTHSGTLYKQFTDIAEPRKILEIYLSNLRTIREFATWGLAQIRYELGVGPSVAPPPYKAPTLKYEQHTEE